MSPSSTCLISSRLARSCAHLWALEQPARPLHSERASSGALFGVQFSVSAALVAASVPLFGGIAVPDLQLSLTADFVVLNQQSAAWLKSINLNADMVTWLSKGRRMCDLVCVNSLSITGFSLVAKAHASFPTLAFSVSVLGTTYAFSSQALSLAHLASWKWSDVLDSVRSALGSLQFCIVDSNCPATKPICDQFSFFTCVATCKPGFFKAYDGCLPNLPKFG